MILLLFYLFYFKPIYGIKICINVDNILNNFLHNLHNLKKTFITHVVNIVIRQKQNWPKSTIQNKQSNQTNIQ